MPFGPRLRFRAIEDVADLEAVAVVAFTSPGGPTRLEDLASPEAKTTAACGWGLISGALG
jgi:hypothetical protein